MGKYAKNVFGEIFSILLILEILAVLIGTSTAAILYDTVTEKVLSTTLALHPEAILTAAAAAFVFHAFISITGTAFSANRKLMKAK